MFTGIIEATGKLENIEKDGTNLHLRFSAPFVSELRVDQSLAHNGVCLTVTAVATDSYNVTAIKETLEKTNLGALMIGDLVNLERCMRADGRFDGHIVQGHVDCVARCVAKSDMSGSHEFAFILDEPTHLIVEKGSVTVNGVSLTVVQASENRFTVHIIPYTLENTNFRDLKPGDLVNVEFDIIGKYVQKMMKK